MTNWRNEIFLRLDNERSNRPDVDDTESVKHKIQLKINKDYIIL